MDILYQTEVGNGGGGEGLGADLQSAMQCLGSIIISASQVGCNITQSSAHILSWQVLPILCVIKGKIKV